MRGPKQWAAVSTWRELIKVPLHNKLLFSNSENNVCHNFLQNVTHEFFDPIQDSIYRWILEAQPKEPLLFLPLACASTFESVFLQNSLKLLHSKRAFFPTSLPAHCLQYDIFLLGEAISKNEGKKKKPEHGWIYPIATLLLLYAYLFVHTFF